MNQQIYLRSSRKDEVQRGNQISVIRSFIIYHNRRELHQVVQLSRPGQGCHLAFLLVNFTDNSYILKRETILFQRPQRIADRRLHPKIVHDLVDVMRARSDPADRVYDSAAAALNVAFG